MKKSLTQDIPRSDYPRGLFMCH